MHFVFTDYILCTLLQMFFVGYTFLLHSSKYFIPVCILVEEHQKSLPYPSCSVVCCHTEASVMLRVREVKGLERQQQQLVAPSPPCLTHLLCSAEQMRQCCNSAASRDASGATARLVAGGGVLIIRANTRPCLCPQL